MLYVESSTISRTLSLTLILPPLLSVITAHAKGIIVAEVGDVEFDVEAVWEVEVGVQELISHSKNISMRILPYYKKLFIASKINILRVVASTLLLIVILTSKP